jgi:DNA-binding NarL/FixJ family response regulator
MRRNKAGKCYAAAMRPDSQRSRTVFIIDDSTMMRSMLRLGAIEAELSVAGETGTVQGALTRCVQLQPDIVLLDLGLPDGDGLELLSEIRERMPGVYIIVVTGNNDQAVVRAAVSRGALGFILKPFSIGTITDTLNNAKRKLAARR